VYEPAVTGPDDRRSRHWWAIRGLAPIEGVGYGLFSDDVQRLLDARDAVSAA
jgi:hypothetical protein